jgi:hypothetical protein
MSTDFGIRRRLSWPAAVCPSAAGRLPRRLRLARRIRVARRVRDSWQFRPARHIAVARLVRVGGLLAALVALVAALTGCQVNTRVAVEEDAGGRGTVAVTVTLDAGAVAAVGGEAALAAQLQDADLVAAGWSVSGPKPGPGSTTVLSASHPFATLAQASALVGDLAGSGPDASRPFRLSLSQHRSFWRTDTTLAGTVDLTCGLSCFGDSGLGGALGSPVGVNPAPLESAAGQQPGQVFTFSVAARLAGSVTATNATSRQGGVLQWTPRLGQTLELSAVTRSWNRSRITAFAIGGGVLFLALIGLLWVVIHRWRRRRRRRARHASADSGGPSAPAGGSGSQGAAVTPRS